MTVLAIDTTGPVHSLALAEDGRLLAERTFEGDLLTGFWPELETFLAEAGLTLKQIDLFAAHRGPGSWTGLRFGLAAAKGLAAAAGKPLFALAGPEVERLARPGRSAAGALAAAARTGRPPEEVAAEYGYQPEFKTLAERRAAGKRKKS
ncbi:MAG TPA: tRNA (adenosine(37)-N6)-threonylcarbamoyltransferase complex dimerization subunit type 1 TsaB [bacterium]|uniref:tRNA threonylcarbamoyladenosine biosynthesis protein TsaB n=1 Tax=candidate division TA06 bacterium ADurb.Bin417 TaxID=1852828 RepID=A0A1V5MM18_UNCT6|nr:MAG: tRNA threonylcarbamoyladenosine biosynthesis protein TsaB [candidate division TA06 bacterium ADurb.Bin417]HNS48241.1 tRNA (adenosine(37)-N6)-threonylcarbamoyltransferase complex dimerization subunit type 1 TsaB [bacterium]